jgi:electron transfer flavoprotein beta subunit
VGKSAFRRLALDFAAGRTCHRRFHSSSIMGLKILCLVKQTFATDAKIGLNASGGIDDAGAKFVPNPYDEFGVEQAIQLKEAGQAESVTILTFGAEAAVSESVRKALAFDADDAIIVDPGSVGAEDLDASVRAAALAAAAKKRGFDLILCGKVAVDSGAGETAGRMAEILGVPFVNVVGKLEIQNGAVVAHREADGRIEVVEAKLPAMVSAEKNLNRPRYPKLPNIMKAKKKPVEKMMLADLLPQRPPATRKTVKYELPPAKEPVKILQGSPQEAAAELVRRLRDEAKVIK